MVEVKKAGVIGWPIAQSLSPMIHGHWLHEFAIEGTYVRLACPPTKDAFDGLINKLRADGFAGCNVTLPHKTHAATIADTRSEIVERLGVANTLTFKDGKIHADNTDVPGFAASLQSAVRDSTPNSALVLGAGGAAPSIILALQQAGCQKIWLCNRTRAKAEELAATFTSMALDICDWDARNDMVANVDVLVNATSLGMAGQPSLEVLLDNVKQRLIVADIVYNPLETPLLRAASARGLQVVNGLEMLLQQAIPGHEKWFDTSPKVTDDLRQKLIKTLEQKQSTQDAISKDKASLMKIGLTGSIGMGKSATGALFAELAIPVWDADGAVHRLYEAGGTAVAPLEAAFPGITGPEGVDRAKLSAHLMAHPEDFKKLEAIVHPLVYQDEQDFTAKAIGEGAEMAVFDIPLLFENRSDNAFDKVIVVSAAPETQRARVLAREDMSEEKFQSILSRQMPDAEKRARADMVIETDRGFAHARRKVYEFVSMLF